MKSIHRIFFQNANQLSKIGSGSVALVVTSPPYPMIEMWDDLFFTQSDATKKALQAGKGLEAFELMHQLLDAVWEEVYRVLMPGGIACINIGDATRTIKDNFILYPNHARILNAMVKIGFTPLPEILWRKQTNAPNKFMGSGMMPPGAYVTLEHEHILILRKGGKREFLNADQKLIRRESAFFWEERNNWFSDVWMDVKGTTQKLNDNHSRLRSAAYPFEVPYRLINMFSVKGDTILDPFLGTGASTAAAMAAGRHSVGIELFKDFLPTIQDRVETIVSFANERITRRFADHLEFIKNRTEINGPTRYLSVHHGFPVVTNQETLMLINYLGNARRIDDASFEINYMENPQGFPDSSVDIRMTNEPIPLKKQSRGRKKKGEDTPKQVQQTFSAFEIK